MILIPETPGIDFGGIADSLVQSAIGIAEDVVASGALWLLIPVGLGALFLILRKFGMKTR